jgi:IS30 family transposase
MDEHKRFNTFLRLITWEDRQNIEKYLKQGDNVYQIGKKINRSASSLYREVEYGGGYENYTAEEAQKVRTLRRKKTSRIYRNDFQNRITNLEMQMEIILEQLEKLYVRN